ncbi:MAG: hypothetical protein LBD50_03410 [Rickettsiales bacterium]|jgi:hypothetical protein|nr:hypothetical protein [Rickettsiales bacterium]
MLPEKEKHYELATRKLLKKADSLPLDKFDRINLKNITLMLRDSFKLEYVREFVLGQEFKDTFHWAAGFCLSSSECVYRLTKGGHIWDFMHINDIWTYGPHCYLRHRQSGIIYDITADQYTCFGMQIPYNLGRANFIGELIYNESPSRLAEINNIDLIAESKRLGSYKG